MAVARSKKATIPEPAEAPVAAAPQSQRIEEPVLSLLRGAHQSAIHLLQKRDIAYRERAAVLAALSKCFPAHLTRHEDDTDGPGWDEDWKTIVCIHFPEPVGQGAWHIHDSEVQFFTHLEVTENDWDGHTTEEKYDRLARLQVQPSTEEAEEKRERLRKALDAIKDRL